MWIPNLYGLRLSVICDIQIFYYVIFILYCMATNLNELEPNGIYDVLLVVLFHSIIVIICFFFFSNSMIRIGSPISS